MKNDTYIPTILNLGECKKHNAAQGIPCFHVPRSNGNGYYPSVCNKRAKQAGYKGQISPRALRNSNGRQR